MDNSASGVPEPTVVIVASPPLGLTIVHIEFRVGELKSSEVIADADCAVKINSKITELIIILFME
jgi:hypothetical protein